MSGASEMAAIIGTDARYPAFTSQHPLRAIIVGRTGFFVKFHENFHASYLLPRSPRSPLSVLRVSGFEPARTGENGTGVSQAFKRSDEMTRYRRLGVYVTGVRVDCEFNDG